MNSGDVTAICAAGAFIFTVLCAVIKGIVDSAISKALGKQSDWLLKEFKEVRNWQTNHVEVTHHDGRQRVQRQTSKS